MPSCLPCLVLPQDNFDAFLAYASRATCIAYVLHLHLFLLCPLHTHCCPSCVPGRLLTCTLRAFLYAHIWRDVSGRARQDASDEPSADAEVLCTVICGRCRA